MTNFFDKEIFKHFEYKTMDYGTIMYLLRNKDFNFTDLNITKDDVEKYAYITTFYEKELNYKENIYQHRCNFFICLIILLAILAGIYLFFFIVGYLNDFMRYIGLFYSILLYPLYILLGIIIYLPLFGIYKYLLNVIYSIKNYFERKFLFSVLGNNASKVKMFLDNLEKQNKTS